jgi:hypothetical protein
VRWQYFWPAFEGQNLVDYRVFRWFDRTNGVDSTLCTMVMKWRRWQNIVRCCEDKRCYPSRRSSITSISRSIKEHHFVAPHPYEFLVILCTIILCIQGNAFTALFWRRASQTPLPSQKTHLLDLEPIHLSYPWYSTQHTDTVQAWEKHHIYLPSGMKVLVLALTRIYRTWQTESTKRCWDHSNPSKRH